MAMRMLGQKLPFLAITTSATCGGFLMTGREEHQPKSNHIKAIASKCLQQVDGKLQNQKSLANILIELQCRLQEITPYYRRRGRGRRRSSGGP